MKPLHDKPYRRPFYECNLAKVSIVVKFFFVLSAFSHRRDLTPDKRRGKNNIAGLPWRPDGEAGKLMRHGAGRYSGGALEVFFVGERRDVL